MYTVIGPEVDSDTQEISNSTATCLSGDTVLSGSNRINQNGIYPNVVEDRALPGQNGWETICERMLVVIIISRHLLNALTIPKFFYFSILNYIFTYQNKHYYYILYSYSEIFQRILQRISMNMNDCSLFWFLLL